MTKYKAIYLYFVISSTFNFFCNFVNSLVEWEWKSVIIYPIWTVAYVSAVWRHCQ